MRRPNMGSSRFGRKISHQRKVFGQIGPFLELELLGIMGSSLPEALLRLPNSGPWFPINTFSKFPEVVKRKPQGTGSGKPFGIGAKTSTFLGGIWGLNWRGLPNWPPVIPVVVSPGGGLKGSGEEKLKPFNFPPLI